MIHLHHSQRQKSGFLGIEFRRFYQRRIICLHLWPITLAYLMFLPRIPFQRWPFRYHLLTASLTVASMAIGGWWLTRHTSSLANERSTELQSLQVKLEAAGHRGLQKTPGNFTESLPLVSRSDEVVNELSRQAQLLGVQISSLSVIASDPSASELRRVQFNLNASAEYKAAKTWLTEILSRYPSLGVQSLSIRGLPNDSVRQETQVSFVLYVKD